MKRTILICAILWCSSIGIILCLLRPWEDQQKIDSTIQAITTISIFFVTLAYAICTWMLVNVEIENRKQQKAKWDIEFSEKRIRGFFVPFTGILDPFIDRLVEHWDILARESDGPGSGRARKPEFTRDLWAGLERLGKFIDENGYLLSAETERQISDLKITALWRTIEGNRSEDWEQIIRESRELQKILKKEHEDLKANIRRFHSY